MAQPQKFWQPWADEEEQETEREQNFYNQTVPMFFSAQPYEFYLTNYYEFYSPYQYQPHPVEINMEFLMLHQPAVPSRMECFANKDSRSSIAPQEDENDEEIDVVNSSDDITENLVIESKEECYKCDYCGANFQSRDRSHIRRCRNKATKRFECPVCLKCFSLKSTLKNHIKIHTGEKPFECGHCGERFRDLSTRNKHERIHTKEKPYRCHFCSFQSAQSGNCKRHMRQKHNAQV